MNLFLMQPMIGDITMGFFSRKRKVSTEEFCTEFYDQSVFSPDIGGVDPWKTFCETSYRSISEVDSTFRQVNLSAFTSELRSLRLEVFGISWLHHVKDKFAPVQSEFTKRYLEEHGVSDIWESMENYNQATARSTTGGDNPTNRLGRGHIVFLNQMRVEIFEKWIKLGYDPKAIARVVNRLGSGTAWKSKRVHTYLAFALTDKLDCEVNDEAIFRISAIIQGFYDGASESIKEVKIVE